MPNPPTTKQCNIFTRARRNNAALPLPSPPGDKEANPNDMAPMAEVLNELKSLRSDFGCKLDNINSSLSDMANKMAALENKILDIKQEVSSNTARIDETERRISDTEDAMEKTADALDLAIKRIAYLESKTEDLENRARRKNLRLFGIREGAEGQQSLFDFISGMLPKWLKVNPEKSFILERVHRTLAPARPNQNRAILIRFLKFQDKEYVYREAKRQDINHDGIKISFAQDLSAETVRIRRGFNTIIKLFIDIDAFRGFQHNPCRLRVVHDGKIHLFSTPQEAEKFYSSILQPK